MQSEESEVFDLQVNVSVGGGETRICAIEGLNAIQVAQLEELLRCFGGAPWLTTGRPKEQEIWPAAL